jgi:flagellar assembly protein FliH
MIMSEPEITRFSLLQFPSPQIAFLPLALPFSAELIGDEIEVEEDPFSLGYDAGMRDAAARFAEERDQLRTLMTNISSLQPEHSEELGLLIAETVSSLVTEIVGHLPLKKEALLKRVHQAVSIIADCDKAQVLRLHPHDALLCEGDSISLTIVPDDALKRGDVRIDCSAGWIENGTSHFLETLRAQLTLKECGR